MLTGDVNSPHCHSAELSSPVNMSHSCCSGNFSSRSFGGYRRYPGSSCGSSYSGNLVYSTDLCSLSTSQRGSSLHSGRQETRCKPTSCQTFCSGPTTATLCHPRWTNFSGSLGCGSSSSCSLGYRSRRCYPLSCGSSGFRPLGSGVCGFPSQSYGSRFCRPTYLSSRSCQSLCYQPTC
ncbi:keratin-associated protein 13-1-like [Saccopteryx bilineata]|uniref:keratin-associated protein 13-1-like n=1 Tax=Saccopteryx bilineata TaxID=59482 RepID=UPI00338EF07A